MRRTRVALALLLSGLLVACSDSGGKPPSSPDDGGTHSSAPGTVTGRAVDTQGRPLVNALVWVQAAATVGLAQATTDAEGRYTVKSLPDLPFRAYAWTKVDYRGKRYCLRLGMPQPSDYDAFSPKDGAVRDFRWQLTGRIEDSTFGPNEDGAYFGGTLLLQPSFPDGDYKGSVELKLTPTGPLIDGSTGQALTRTVDLTQTTFALDIPTGPYTVKAEYIKQGGTRIPLKVGPDSSQLADEAAIEFGPEDIGCGGNFGSGLTRAFLFLTHP